MPELAAQYYLSEKSIYRILGEMREREVYCPLEVCRQRNIIRGDRYENQSQEQYEIMAKDIRYSARVDTSACSAHECAEQIIRELFAGLCCGRPI